MTCLGVDVHRSSGYKGSQWIKELASCPPEKVFFIYGLSYGRCELSRCYRKEVYDQNYVWLGFKNLRTDRPYVELGFKKIHLIA